MSYTVEKHWEFNGLECIVIMTDMGYRCGYAGIPESHCLYGIKYSKETYKLNAFLETVNTDKYTIDKTDVVALFCGGAKNNVTTAIQVHGGVTYSDTSGKYPVKADKLWWFGYDCGHAGDAKDLTAVSDSLREIELKYPTGGVLRTTDYCIEECESLADQLLAIEVAYRFRENLLFRKFI